MTKALAPSCSAVAAVAAAAAVVCSAKGAATMAATVDTQRKSYDIGGGEAAETLKRFADESGKQIVYLIDIVRGVTTNPVKGEYTAHQALDRLLVNTGLTAIQDEKTGALMITAPAGTKPSTALSPSTPQPQTTPKNQSNPMITINKRKNPIAWLIGLLVATGSIAPAQVAPAPQAATPGAATGKDEIVVLETFKVFSSSRAEAVEAQRQSNRIGSFIGTDALGSLPDDNVGDALNRLAGINVVGSGTDGRAEVSIRGLEGKHNLLLLNGNSLTFADSDLSTSRGTDTRSFDVSTIPVDDVKSIEVIKSITPDVDASAVGGVINVETTSASELKNQKVKYKFEYRAREAGSEGGWGGSLSYAMPLNADRTLGATLNLTYRNENYRKWRMELRQANLPPFESDGTLKVPLLSQIEPRDERVAAKTTTLSGSVDWKLSDTTSVYFKPYVNLQDLERLRIRWRYRNLNASRNAVYMTSFAPDATTTTEVTNFRRSEDFRFAKQYRYYPKDTADQIRLLFGGTTKLTGGRLNYALGFGDSRNQAQEKRSIFDTPSTDPTNSSIRPRRLWRVTYDNTNTALPVARAVAVSDPTVDRFNSALGQGSSVLSNVRFQDFDYHDKELTAKLDYENFGKGSRAYDLKMGAKLNRKSRVNRTVLVDWKPDHKAFGRTISEAEFPLSDIANESFSDRYLDGGFSMPIKPVYDFFDANRSKFVRSDGNEWIAQSGKNYDASETIVAAYGMATARLRDLTLIGGVRYEHTANTYNWRASLIDPPSSSLPRLDDVKGSKSYDNFFPGVVGTYRLGDQHILRAAITRSISRPDYEDLVPFNQAVFVTTWGASAAPTDDDDTFESGNPNLKAQTATNYDLGYEFYFGKSEQNTLSVNYFRKELKDFLFTFHAVTPFVDSTGGTAFRTVEFVANGSKQTLNGVELSWTQSLDGILPSPLDGFRFLANYTYISGEETTPVLDPVTQAVLGQQTSSRLVNQPAKIANFQLYYEKGRINARVAYNYVGEFQFNIFDVAFPTLQASRQTLDASFQFSLTKRLRLAFDVKNITDEPSSWVYNTSKAFPESYGENGRMWIIGIRSAF